MLLTMRRSFAGAIGIESPTDQAWLKAGHLTSVLTGRQSRRRRSADDLLPIILRSFGDRFGTIILAVAPTSLLNC
jgi:hypothetical protein